MLEGSPAHGARRTVVKVTLQEATGVSAKGRICGVAEAAAVARGSGSDKGQPASDFRAVDGEDESSGSSLEQEVSDNIKLSIQRKIFSSIIFPCFVRSYRLVEFPGVHGARRIGVQSENCLFSIEVKFSIAIKIYSTLISCFLMSCSLVEFLLGVLCDMN